MVVDEHSKGHSHSTVKLIEKLFEMCPEATSLFIACQRDFM